MNPFYFGSSGKRLFGVYHPPRPGAARSEGVVLCQPTRDEYAASHWAFRRMAILLAAEGFPVLRFDYYGTGDSYGDGREATIERATADIAAAIDELKDTGGVRKVSLIGLRVGATLAAIAARDRQDVVRVVLWDPVVYGRRHLQELRLRHAEMNVEPDPRETSEDGEGLFGFPMTGAMRADFERLDLTAVDRFPGNRAFLVTGEESPDYRALEERLGSLRVELTHERIPGRRVWEKRGEVSRQFVPVPVLRRIMAWQLESDP